ncbi:MAG: hypothetical protein NC038_05585 [Paludibacter sp.]|nr:hypothetical protein [Bacteroidales bacterium]MCM1069844.1 hypothetical protein [Prevotella sp.]MCM1353963.1 hypothetical protein [Bacteroides sp.]MCM1443395.1 hypothetical protein [Muribaculum sp.]MCM1482098.1 hypothetical protein [Paludibacter sp.]
MRKTLYKQITAALEMLPEIAHIDLFNNQLTYSEGEQPFLTPAVLIEFDAIEWRHLLHGVREAAIQIHLHVITDSRVSPWAENIKVFDLLDRINHTLHGLHAMDENGSIMDALTLAQSSTDHDFDELQDNIETYQCHVTDRSAYC